MYKDSIEYLIKELEKSNADNLKQTFDVQKDGKYYTFEISLKKRK